MFCKKNTKGFTLIELLVVVAIIGVLATVVLGSLSSARASARDARRLSDLKTMQTALEIYYLDHGSYPMVSWRGSHLSSWDSFLDDLGISSLVDPINESSSTSGAGAIYGDYVYSYFGHSSDSYCSGQAYFIVANLEEKKDESPGVEMCNDYFYHYSDSVVVGINRYGDFIGPGVLESKD